MFSCKVQAVQYTKSDVGLSEKIESTLLCDFQSIPVLDQEAKTGKNIMFKCSYKYDYLHH